MAMRSASLLEVGQVLAGRFFIDRRLGGVEGGFGQIYVAKDIGGGPQVAIKAESIIAQVQLFRQEAEVLRQLRVLDSPNCVKLADIGSTSSCTWIATTLGGPNLAELRRQCREERFQPTTVARLAVEMLKGLEALHQVGFVHRDVKPNNFILAGDGSRRILLIDFGLCRSYRDGLSRRLLPPRAHVGFRGTVRYASLNTHAGGDQSRTDDLWSLLYVLVEMITGELPWRSFTDKKAIECQKFRFPPSLLVDKVVQLGGPAELHSFVAELGRLDFFTSPNYRRLRGIFRCFLIRRGVKSTDPYDWEVQGPSPPQRHGTEGFRPSHNVSGCPARYSCLGANGSLLASRINIRPRR